MIRRALLAALLCVVVWAIAGRLVTPASGDTATAASTASALSEHSGDTDSRDARWNARQRSSVSTTASGWSSQHAHVELPGVHRRGEPDSIPRADVLTHPAPGGPRHQHTIPLLI